MLWRREILKYVTSLVNYMGFGKILGIIFVAILVFCAFNGFLLGAGVLQISDFILANGLLIIVVYFAYLTYEIQQIKQVLKMPRAK